MTKTEALELVTYWNGGVQAESADGNRWFKVYAADPDSDRAILEAGYDMMPADFREEHESADSALDALALLVSPELWQIAAD